jgi:hypothetical protein
MATQSPKHFRLRTWLRWLTLTGFTGVVGAVKQLHQHEHLMLRLRLGVTVEAVVQLHQHQQLMMSLPLVPTRSVERKRRKLPGKRRRSKLRALVAVMALVMAFLLVAAVVAQLLLLPKSNTMRLIRK